MSESTPLSLTDRMLECLKAHRLVFAHVGYLFEPADALKRLCDLAKQESLSPYAVDVTSESLGQVLPQGDESLASMLYIIDGWDVASDRSDRCELLGRCRLFTESAGARDARVWLWSSVPGMRLLGCPGSSVVRDAKHFFLDPLSNEEIEGRLDVLGVSKFAAQAAMLTAGLPALVTAVAETLHETGGTMSRADGARLNSELSSAVTTGLAECGPEAAAWLDDLVFRRAEHSQAVSSADIDAVEAGRGAGVLQSDDGWQSCRLAADAGAKIFKDGLRDYCDFVLDTPRDLGVVYRDLWEIERILRSYLLRAARAHHGKDWRAKCIPDKEVASACLKKAQFDGYLCGAIADLANPIEWLTSVELALILTEQPWARPSSIPQPVLARAFAELGPIRNRIAHMRLIQPEDATVAREWRTTFERLRSEGVVAHEADTSDDDQPDNAEL